MPNPSSYFLASSFVQKPAPASLPSNVPPTFAGIVTLNQNLDGSVQASWSAVTFVPNPPVRYEVYVQQGSATGLFNISNLQSITPRLTQKISEDAAGNTLQFNKTYFVGVRAVDAYGNRETNLISLSQTINYANFNTVASAVWDVVRTTRNTPGTFGESLTARVDVDVSTRAATADTRFANLDATISSRATQTSVTTIDTKLGSPTGISVSADIASVQTKLGTPTGVSVSADVAAVKDVSDTINSKIGTPTGASVSADISAVKGVSDTINSKIGTPTGASVSADVAAVKSDTTTINSRVDVVVSTRASQSSVNAIPTNPLLTTDSRLNNLDATISSRASASQVTSIQNNTSFVGVVPSPLLLPETGSKDYLIYVRLFDNSGTPQDPDLNQIYLSAKDSAGGTVISSTLMTRDALGQYSYDYSVSSTDTQQSLYFFFDYVENSVAFNQVRSTEVVEFESKLDTLLSRLTPTRATNLDNLDVAVSTRSTQTLVTTINSKIGTPTGASVSVDIAAVKTTADSVDGKVDVTLSTRATQSSVTAIDTKLGTPNLATVSLDIAAIQATADAVPTAAENADAVWEENVNDHATGTTTARTLKDAKIFSQIDL